VVEAHTGEIEDMALTKKQHQMLNQPVRQSKTHPKHDVFGSVVQQGKKWVSVPPLKLPVVQSIPCREADPELWFSSKPVEIETAIILCSACPIQTACYNGALERKEPWGIWGGKLFDHGTVINAPEVER
jgi:WhiB family redox-sensing transcriptional regulator